jgi:hypothetical protein
MNWLPKHECGLYLEHNSHKDCYESVDSFYDHLDDSQWVSDEEHIKAIDEDSVWTLQWYPNTPIGSHTIAASSLEAIQKYFGVEP